MAEAESGITFLCGFCEHVIKAPAAAEGRAGRCPRCQRVVSVPQLSDAAGAAFKFVDPDFTPPAKLRGLFHGVAVSLALHTVVLSLLGLVLFQSKELGRSILVTLFFDTEGSRFEVDAMPIEMPAPSPAAFEGDAMLATDLQSLMGSPGDKRIPDPPTTYGNHSNCNQGLPANSGSIDPLARFSPTVVDRLARQPAAERGDYEVALFWDGPSDLDLHVRYQSNKGNVSRSINYLQKGSPKTGFLDVDQNCQVPYVIDPIEHIRWNTQSPPPGTYTILVHGYKLRRRDGSPAVPEASADGKKPYSTPPKPEPFTVEVKTPDGVRSISGAAGAGLFIEVLVLQIAGTGSPDPAADPDQKSAESAVDLQLAAARKKLEQSDKTSQRTGKGLLKGLIRRFPDSSAASDARSLLQQLE